MTIIGHIVKGLIEAKDAITLDSDPIENQKKVLQELLETARDTKFGVQYKFDKLLKEANSKKAFADTVPYFDYNSMESQWWKHLHEGQSNISWPGNPDYFALSSGTTGKTSKRIPVTNTMISAIRNAGIQQVFALSNFDLPPSFFEKGILMLGSSTDLEHHDDHLEGEISGISASNIPSWFSGFYKPGKDIAAIDDWDERVARIAEKAKDWDIGAISGIPSWIELMLRKVIETHNLDNIHDIWPNLQVYTSGGVAFGPYEKTFNSLMGKPITVIDTYLASEGFIAFQSRPDTDAMQLVTDNGIYFEFVPFLPEYINQDGSLVQDAPSVGLDEVKKGQDYVLIISTVAGTWRYLIGDTIEFTNVEKAEIKITGRTKFFLNTVGSQLSVNKLDKAILELESKFDIEISEYTLCAKKFEEGFYHSWYLGVTKDINDVELSKALDDFLMSVNKNYKVARGKALKGVKVTTIAPDIFYEWNNLNKKKGGQVKMERVMGEEKFATWEEFVWS